jgi:hypothetical protein
MEGMKKTLSIAPSYECSLICEGCYLTTDVTKEMRKATKGDYYWRRVFSLAVHNGYQEIAMTLNPFPGAIEVCIKHAKWAKEAGFESVNVTVTWGDMMKSEQKEGLLEVIDVLSESIDENRTECLDIGTMLRFPHIHYNINLLWSREIFEANVATDGNMDLLNLIIHRKSVGLFGIQSTMQHLILKPLSLYPSGEWFQEHYTKALELDWLAIAGDGAFHIGDLAYGNLIGLNNCPGDRMMDIDPMGMIRRCPENKTAYDGTNLAKVRKIMENGIPGCSSGCDCITPK